FQPGRADRTGHQRRLSRPRPVGLSPRTGMAARLRCPCPGACGMNGTDVLDDYLGELLQSAQPATSTVAAEPAADAVVDLPAPAAESAAIAEPERMPEPEPVPAACPAPVAAAAPVAAEVSPAAVPATDPAPRPTAPAAPVPP